VPPRTRMPLPRRRRIPKLVAGGGLVAVVVAGLVARSALADSPGSSSMFRTAVVKSGSVSQVLQRSATIEPIAEAAVAFPVAGTVAGVTVQPGQSVSTGQTLATLDTTALQNDVAARQATLAGAQLTLQNALDEASTAAAQSTTSTTVASAGGATGRGSGSSDPSAGIENAAQQVVSAKQRVDATVSTATTAVQNAAAACGSSSASSDCTDAQQSSLAALQAAADAESALATRASNLDDLLNTGFVTSSSTGSPSSSSSSSTASASATARSGSAGGNSSAVPSAADLVADQAAVDAAASAVTAAQQSLAQATIVSPLEGTVAAVNMVAAQQVSAGSSTANVIVVGPGGYEATTTVSVADIAKVKPGEDAAITPDGTNAALPAKVVSIGVSPSTSGSTTSYPVILGFTGSPSGLRNGASAAVTITVAHAADALTVPTSAVHAAGGLRFVMTLVNGKTTNVPVQIGAVGPDVTEITSGLQSGQIVVLADLSQPLPTSTNTNVRGFGGGGGFGGGPGTFVSRGG